MTFQQLLAEYKKVEADLDERYPIVDREKRSYIYLTKVMEEIGELSEVMLAKSNLQRPTKKFPDVQTKISEEYADVLSTLIILGFGLDINIEQAIEQKLKSIRQRAAESVQDISNTNDT